jgi:membrane-associated HD superfamily phosphohydrolase
MATDVIDVASLGAEPGQSTETSVESDAGVVSSVENVGGNQESQQQEAQQLEIPQQVTGKAIRDAVRTLAEAHPEQKAVLKQMADAFFRETQGWKGAFDAPQKALEAKQLIEAAGGAEAIAQAQQRLAGYDAQETGLESGDPAVLDSFFEDYPQGAAQLAPHYLARLEKTNPAALASAVGPYAVDLLTQAGLGSHLEMLLAETDPARVKTGLQMLSEWFKGQRQNAQQTRQMGATAQNPQAEQIKKQQEALNQEREQIFSDGVTAKVNADVASPLTALVDQYAKQYKLNDAQKAHYRETLVQTIIKDMNADENYKQQANLRRANKKRSVDSVASFVAGEFTRRAKEKAFEVAKSIYGAPRGGAVQPAGTGVVKPTTPQTAAGGGPLLISARPPNSQLDLNRPDADLLLIKGQGYLKDGRFVTWRRQPA